MSYVSTQTCYNRMREYFSRPDAVLAKTGDGCLYRDKDGNKCAVGCLIPDEVFDRPATGIAVARDSFLETEPETIADELNVSGSIWGVKQAGFFNEVPELRDILNGGEENVGQEVAARKWKFLEDAQRLHDSYSADAAEFVILLKGLAYGAGLHVEGV